MKKDRQVLTFLQNHQWLFSDPRFSASAKRQKRIHMLSLARTQQKAASAKATLVHRQQVRRLAAYQSAQSATPSSVICRTFGSYCQEALQVSRCESGLTTTAQNGQYLGLFQMGSSERRIYGHGSTAIAQATAAHRYFVDSGSNWGPWSCKPWS